MSRPACLLWLCIALAALGSCDRAADKRPPSVLLISIDTLRADHVHCYGYERETTPTLDRLAAAGARFTQHVSNTSWTLPSHASMLTGLGETVHGVVDDDRVIDPARELLSETLADRGYRTAGFFSGPYLHPTYGFGQGFEVYESAIVLRRPEDREDVWHLTNDVDRMRLIERNSYQQRTGPELAARATAWLDSIGEDEPFFLFVHFFDCHWDYMPPEEYWRKFDPDYDDPTFDGRQFISNPLIHQGMDPRHLQHLLARYDGEILFTDDMVSRIVDRLAALGRADDTLIAITSDHGEEFFEHGKKGHRNNLFDESLRVPWILHQPGVVPAGVEVTAQTSVIDVMPTILDLVDVDVGHELSGESVTPLLRGETPAALVDRPAFGRLVLGQQPEIVARFLRTRERKLVASRAGATPYDMLQLYDLVDDPDELSPDFGNSNVERDGQDDMFGAFRRLQQHDEADARHASMLRLDTPGAVPQIDLELHRQLVENGYLGDG